MKRPTDTNSKPIIFFDIGHTLVTGSPASPRRLLGHKLDLTEKEIKVIGKLIMTYHAEHPGELTEVIAGHINRIEKKVIFQAVQDIWDEQVSCVELLPGVEETIESLSEARFKLGLISNIWHPFFVGFQSRYPGLVKKFDYQILSYKTGCKKPSKEIFLRALAISKRKPNDCWMIGDTYELDIAPAIDLGFKTVWFILRPNRETEAVAKVIRNDLPKPDYAVHDLREILSLFIS